MNITLHESNIPKSTPRLNDYGQPIGIPVPNWTPRERPPRTNIDGKRVRLELLSDKHVEDLFEAYRETGDDRDWTYLSTDYYPQDLPTFQKFIEARASCKDLITYAVITLASGKAVGMMSFMRIDEPNGNIEIGYVNLSNRLMRSPQSTEAIFLLARRAFDELGYRRLEWKCDNFNERSKSAALRYGFQFEGIFRQARVCKGRSRDDAWFSIIDSEWPAIRLAFENWLDPANFDTDGRQKCRLSDLISAVKQTRC